jgi:hypothetical protein
MLHAGLDLSRKKIDICLLSEWGEHVDQLAVPPDADALRTLARRIDGVYREPVCAVGRVDDRCPARPRHARAGGLGCRDRRRAQGEGPGAAGLIAVGTAVANGPPRRSQRALLTHWAPALGSGVEARFGPGMLHADGR